MNSIFQVAKILVLITMFIYGQVAFGQDETMDLKTALIIVSEQLANEKHRADSNESQVNDLKANMEKSLAEAKKEASETRNQMLMAGALALPTGLFLGGLTKDINHAAILACSGIGVETLSFGIYQLFSMRSNPAAPIPVNQPTKSQ